MRKKRISFWGVLKNMMKASMLISLIFVGMRVGGLYNEYKHDNPDLTPWEFISFKEEIEYRSYDGTVPQDVTDKLALFNNTVKSVWYALFFYIMFEIFSFKENKKEHWLTQLVDKLDKLWKKKDETENNK